MSLIRCYLPVIALLLWAAVAELWGLTEPYTSIAIVTVALAFWVQVAENRRVRRARNGGPGRAAPTNGARR